MLLMGTLLSVIKVINVIFNAYLLRLMEETIGYNFMLLIILSQMLRFCVRQVHLVLLMLVI